MEKENKASKFWDFVKDNNLALSLEEAFKMFPAEKEWHQGDLYKIVFGFYEDEFLRKALEKKKILNIFEPNRFEIREGIKLSKYKIGDIVYVPKFEYPNGITGKHHLFVVIDAHYHVVIPFEYLTMILSSRLEKLKYKENIYLPKDGNNNLNKNSIIKTDYLYNFMHDQIECKIGCVDPVLIENFKNLYLQSLKK